MSDANLQPPDATNGFQAKPVVSQIVGENDDSPPPFEFITENVYITERGTSREGKRNKRMMCACQFDPETDSMADACGDDCLNRLLMIECGSRCPCGEYCNNKKFTRRQYASVEVFRTELKGWGLKATSDIAPFSFVMEYCGEVCTLDEFEIRRKEYEKENRRHYYFMSLKTDEILDATKKGNLSRFINHSCNPNCETQKWTVNGRLRVGFFALRHIRTGEELTFDYQFQRFGESAQKCYCGSENCRGYLGAAKQTDSTCIARSDMFVPSPANTRERKIKHRGDDADSIFEKEIYDVVGSTWRLRNADQVLSLSRLMLTAESFRQRTMLLRVVQATKDPACLKRFLSLQGLRLLWSWMIELTDQHTTGALEAKMQVLLCLQHLPILNKNLLTDNKILEIVQKWSQHKPAPRGDQESVVISEADCSISQHENESKEEERMEEVNGSYVQNDTEKDVVSKTSDVGNEEKDSKDFLLETSSEAEGKETIAVVEDVESKIVNLATELLAKWSSLKEVFRIPKKVIPVTVSNNEQLKHEKKDEEDIYISKKRKRESRWESSDGDHMASKVRDKLSPSNVTSPKPNNPVCMTRSGLLGPPPSGAMPPLQNTLIVQHQSGQSVYVQQQIFPPTIPHGLIPAQYAHVQFPPTLPSLQPLPVASTVSSMYPSTATSTPQTVTDLQLTPLPPPPPVEKSLPANWKEAKELSGKVYYYHTITRKTQWERPTEEDRDGEILMDLATPDIDNETEEQSHIPTRSSQSSYIGEPHTPDESPPSSPESESNKQTTGEKKRSATPKDVFKHSLSKLIVRCLDHHRKPNCKYGRITCSEDFKHLARKLTLGITEKEIVRKGSADVLEFNDQVKSRTKAYIKNYMKKFGPIYSHS